MPPMSETEPTTRPPVPLARQRVYNRVVGVMLHTRRYSFRPQARLAKDAGVCPSTVSRFLSGESNPSFALVMAITRALEEQLGRRVDPRELVSMDGTYPTASVCELCGCRGCLPPQVYREDDTVRPEYGHIRSGSWALGTPGGGPPGAEPDVLPCGQGP